MTATHTGPFTRFGLAKSVYGLHAFQKKSKKGVQTPKHVIDLIKHRLRTAERDYRERKEAK